MTESICAHEDTARMTAAGEVCPAVGGRRIVTNSTADTANANEVQNTAKPLYPVEHFLHILDGTFRVQPGKHSPHSTP